LNNLIIFHILILDLSSEIGNVNHISEESYFIKSSSGAIKIQLHTVSIDRGMSWDNALKCYNQSKEENINCDFYLNSSVSKCICV
jgi:hypothetical protein